MTKRIIAFACMLAILAGVFILATTRANAADATYKVGYARVDINPYRYHYANDDDHASYYDNADTEDRLTDAEGKQYCIWYRNSVGERVCDIMPLPLHGMGNVWDRPCTGLMDDNNDGIIDENDGLKLTCIAISDSEGNTILLITMDVIAGVLTDQIRESICAAFSEAAGVTENRIIVTGTHAHSAPAIDDYKTSDTRTSSVTIDGVTYQHKDMNTDLGIWIDRVIAKGAEAATLAMNDRANATLTKGTIAANSSQAAARKVMNSVRHYTAVDDNGVKYVFGDNFNPGHTDKKYQVTQISQVDDSLHLLQFQFSNTGKKPIVLANWRAHPSLNARGACFYYASSDYVNAFRHTLETTNSCRVAFFQGASGNVNPRGKEWNNNIGSSGQVASGWIDAFGDGQYGNGYGSLLAQVAKELLNGTNSSYQMAAVTDAGAIRTYQYTYGAERNNMYWSDLSYDAAEAAKKIIAKGKTSPVIYPDDVLSGSYALDQASDPDIYNKALAYQSTGEQYVIPNTRLADYYTSRWDRTNGRPASIAAVELELNVFKLGTGVAFVTAPGELFDRYYYTEAEMAAGDTVSLSNASSYNRWDKLVDNTTYGTPFVLGYCGRGYYPNTLAYTYNSEGAASEKYSLGSYESVYTTVAQGTGEKIIDIYDQLLALEDGESLNRTAPCEHCGMSVTWQPYNCEATLTSGHYYLLSNTRTSQISIPAGEEVCVDLNGYTLTGDTRAFYIKKNESGLAGAVLSIMDSSVGQTGVVQGHGSRVNTASTSVFGGGTIFVNAGATINLYSGTLAYEEQIDYEVRDGGVVYVRGTFNMFGGKVTGGKAWQNGDSIFVDFNNASEIGRFCMIDGIVTADLSNTGNNSSSDCVYSEGFVELAGSASVEEILFAEDSNAAAPKMGNWLTVKGSYTGSVVLKYSSAVTLGVLTDVGDCQAGENGQTADVSYANIRFAADTNLTAAVKGSELVVSNEPYTYGTCEICGECQWRPMKDADWDALGTEGMTSGHYVLTEDTSTSQKQINKGQTETFGAVCLDLAGHTFDGASRAFLIYKNATLNIMDSVGNGIVQGNSGTNIGGGVLYVYTGAVINLYDGTVRLASEKVLNSGVVRLHGGTLNMHGGTIAGGKVSDYGGAIGFTQYEGVYGTFTASGGQVTAGEADTAGDCVYVPAGGRVNLSGDAQIADIYFAGSSADTLAINGAFTGSVQLTYAGAVAANDDIGNCTTGTDLSRAAVTLADSNLVVSVAGTNLVAVEYSVVIRDKDGNLTGYGSFSEAISSFTYSEADRNYIKLIENIDENVTISGGDVYLDLNGYDFTGNITVADGYTLFCMDSKTDDYDVSDGNYGKIKSITQGSDVKAVPIDTVSAVEAGTQQSRACYLAIQEADGLSFHRVQMRVKSMSYSPSDTGVYFNCAFNGDSVVKENIISFGVAVSAIGEPDQASMGVTSRFTRQDGAQLGMDTDATSVMVYDIMKTTGSLATNRSNAQVQIYSRAYIQIGENAFIFGKTEHRSLQEQIELAVEKLWDTSSDSTKTALIEMYEAYPDVIKVWNVPKLKDAIQVKEDKALKVLVLGNSHSLDSVNLLYEVFKAEGLPAGYDDLVLGVMYKAGCKMYEHAYNIQRNQAAYTYYKNDGTSQDGTWTKTNSSNILTALEDEQWDIVVLQEMNRQAGTVSEFNDDDIQIVINYVNRKLEPDPILLWNMVWTNPMLFDDDQWVFADGMPVPTGYSDQAMIDNKVAEWKEYHESFGYTSAGMYDAMTTNVNTYILGTQNAYSHGAEFDGVLASGTAIEYIKNYLQANGKSAKDAEMTVYRDYTHLSNFGRVVVAYQWYAQIMDQLNGNVDFELTAVNFGSVSKQLWQTEKAFSAYTGLTLKAGTALTSDQKTLIMDAVNHTLKNPLNATVTGS